MKSVPLSLPPSVPLWSAHRTSRRADKLMTREWFSTSGLLDAIHQTSSRSWRVVRLTEHGCEGGQRAQEFTNEPAIGCPFGLGRIVSLNSDECSRRRADGRDGGSRHWFERQAPGPDAAGLQ